MKDILKKVFAHAGADALVSARAFEEAALGLGCSPEEIAAAVRDFDGFPLDDDDLADIAGGINITGGGTGNGGYTNSTVGGGGGRLPL